MPDKPIPEELRKFIVENIETIADLEGLLLLRANESQDWDARAVAERLYINEDEADKLLEKFHARSFLQARKDQGLLYRYAPATEEQSRMVTLMAELYAKYLVPITHMVHSNSKNRIQQFADAFWIRKEEK